jgi:glycine/D-amino acid oxidase-like deaminating enzyme
MMAIDGVTPRELTMKAEVVICGAGIAGVSAAHALAVEKGVQNILLVDEGAPLSLTSDHSTECYRNWWPGPGNAMVALMNHSINRMEVLARLNGNTFGLNRRGYLYCTASPARAAEMKKAGEQISGLGAGPLRLHSGKPDDPTYQPAHPDNFEDQPDGADLLLDPGLILRHFPFLTQDIVAALHVRRAGWFSAQQLGMLLLAQAKSSGVRFISARVVGIDKSKGCVTGVRLADGERIETPVFINAAGPHLKTVGRMVGVELPVYNELHLKLAMRDTQRILDRSAPLVIWSDPQRLDWSAEEQEYLHEEPEAQLLLGELPSGIHTRPEGGADCPIVLVLWEYHTRQVEPVWPIDEDPLYPDVVMRGLTRMIPGMQTYLQKASKPRVDGGYYTKTSENRPLIGKLPIEGAFVIGALSGYGLMAACAAGELLADQVTGGTPPSYAAMFSLDRYDDPAYRKMLDTWEATGQL